METTIPRKIKVKSELSDFLPSKGKIDVYEREMKGFEEICAEYNRLYDQYVEVKKSKDLNMASFLWHRLLALGWVLNVKASPISLTIPNTYVWKRTSGHRCNG
jgi:hypothetical protein